MTTPLGAALLEAVAYHLGSSSGFYQDIVQKRFGLTVSSPVTLETLAQDAGCTRERIRQIETQFIAHIEAMAAKGNARFPDLEPLRTTLRQANGTWADGTRRAEELLGYPVYLPGLFRLTNCAGYRLPPVGFGSIVLAHGYSAEEVRLRLETTLAKRIQAKEVAAWMAAPHKQNFQDAPVWAIEALKRSETEAPKTLPDEFEGLSQRELIRVLMLRSGYTRRQTMDYLEVNRSTFDRWLWPADNPTPIPPAIFVKLVELAHKVGPDELPRTRHLGPPKEYAHEGIPGCARRSRSRESGSVIALYKTDQANLPPAVVGPWTTICETHNVAANWKNFATGLRAMAQAFVWCPDCQRVHAQGLVPPPPPRKRRATKPA